MVDALHIDLAAMDIVGQGVFQDMLDLDILNWAALHCQQIVLFINLTPIDHLADLLLENAIHATKLEDDIHNRYITFKADLEENGDIYITAYGPCSINSEKMKIKEETPYPFRNNVIFKIKGKGNIYLKKPVWAKEMDITLNSAKIDADTNENGYVKVNLTEDANEIRIDFKAEIEVLHIDDSEGVGRLPLAFKYGALVYSLKIEPIVHKFNPKNRGKIDEEWTWYDLEPYYKEADVEDSHERTLLRRNQFSFNVAVDGKITADDVKVVLKDTDGYAWESPYIALKIPAYKAPYAYTPYPTRTVEVFEDTQVVTDKLKLELVPYGCTNLRITYFPRARV